MAHIVKPRVAETSTSTGTGAVTLAGAITGHRAFSAVCSIGDTVQYEIVAVDTSGNPTGDWEEGLGTYSGASTLTRTTVTNSSNAGAAVDFAAGAKVVLLTPIARRLGLSLSDSTVQDKGSVSGAVTVDLSMGRVVTATIAGATTFAFTGLVAGEANSVALVLTNPGVGALTFPTGTVFDRNAAPTLPASGKTVLVLETYDNGTTWAATQAWRNVA